jgi:hypothetical protein
MENPNPVVLVHALEGKPDDPIKFTGKSERDIRVRWLVADPEDAAVGRPVATIGHHLSRQDCAQA